MALSRLQLLQRCGFLVVKEVLYETSFGSGGNLKSSIKTNVPAMVRNISNIVSFNTTAWVCKHVFCICVCTLFEQVSLYWKRQQHGNLWILIRLPTVCSCNFSWRCCIFPLWLFLFSFLGRILEKEEKVNKQRSTIHLQSKTSHLELDFLSNVTHHLKPLPFYPIVDVDIVTGCLSFLWQWLWIKQQSQ